MLQVYFSDMNLTLRDCILEDAAMLLIWRNSEKVRHFSHNPHEIDQDSHDTWLRQRLTEIRTQPFWIISLDEKCAGYIRFDLSKKYTDALDVSILIAEEHQGLGIAAQILSTAIQRIRQDFKTHSVYADVHVDNLNSFNLFKKCGFNLTSEEGKFSTLKYLNEGA